MGGALRLAAALAVAALLLLPALARASPDSVLTIQDGLSGPGYPAVALDEHGSPHVLWQDPGTGRVNSAWIDLASGHIVGTRVLNPNSGGMATFPTPRLVSSGSRLFAGWIDCCSTAVVARSDDGGVTFTNPLQAPAESPDEIDIAADPAGVLYAVWHEYGDPAGGAIAFSILPANSSTFAPRQIVQPRAAQAPAVAVAGARVYVAWEGVNGTVMVNRSDDGGRTFLPAVTLDPFVAWLSSPPRLVTSGDRGYAVWASHGGTTSVRFASLRADGNFTAPVEIGTTFPGPDPRPTLALGANGSVYAAWSDVALSAESQAGRLLVRRADANGSGWQDAASVQESGVSLSHPALAVDAGGHYFLAHDRAFAGPTGPDSQVRLATDLAFPWELSPAVAAALALVGGGLAVLGVAAWVLLRPRRKSPATAPEPAGKAG